MEEEIRVALEGLRKEIQSEFDQVHSEIDNRVTFKTFTWVLGVLLAIIIGILGIIYAKVESIDNKASATQNSVSRIEGQLIGAEIIK